MAATSVVSRADIRSWAEGSHELWLLRKGMEGVQAISEQSLMDERGYQYLAGVHGGFGNTPYCQHGNANFVTWHRPYLLDFELKLRAAIAKVTDQATADEWRLPYWQWDDPAVDGLPAAFTVATYDDQGTERENPLLRRPYQLPYPFTDSPLPHDVTWRDPNTLAQLRALRADVESALGSPQFQDFRVFLENAHNGLHRWVRGFMLSLRSSFDPIFWVHHCNVDRLFWKWQQEGGDQASIPQAVRNFDCLPFRFVDIRAQAFFDTRPLGYTYAIERQLVQRPDAEASTASLPLEFAGPPARYDQARVNFHGLRHPEQTVTILLFANRAAPADGQTARTAAEGYLGSATILGHGECPGGDGHCDPDQQTGRALRPPHHRTPFDTFIDVTARLREVVPEGPIHAQLLVVDADDAVVSPDAVAFDNASMTYR